MSHPVPIDPSDSTFSNFTISQPTNPDDSPTDDTDYLCCHCNQHIFRAPFQFAFYCQLCTPRMFFCSSTPCKQHFLTSHPSSHPLSTHFSSLKDFVEVYVGEITELCDGFVLDEKYAKCIRLCQRSLGMITKVSKVRFFVEEEDESELESEFHEFCDECDDGTNRRKKKEFFDELEIRKMTTEFALYVFRLGMVCHVNLLEYTEAKRCGKTAVRILESLEKLRKTEKKIMERSRYRSENERRRRRRRRQRRRAGHFFGDIDESEREEEEDDRGQSGSGSDCEGDVGESSSSSSIDVEHVRFVKSHCEIVSKLCHIYLKLENARKCLSLGQAFLENRQKQYLLTARVIQLQYSSTGGGTPSTTSSSSALDDPDENIGSGLVEYVSNRIDDVKYVCGKASCVLEKYEMAERLLSDCLDRRCGQKDFVKARYAMASLLDVYLLRGLALKGISVFRETKKRFPDLVRKQSDGDQSFLRMKKTVTKLRHMPQTDYIDLESSIDGKVINFNKQQFEAVTESSVSSSYVKLKSAIEVSEDLLLHFARNDALVQIGPIMKKRNQLIRRMYCCCLKQEKPEEAFLWMERGRSFLLLARIIESSSSSASGGVAGAAGGGFFSLDLAKIFQETGSPSTMIDLNSLVHFAREQRVVFLSFVVVKEIHFDIGDFIDAWVINPADGSGSVRVRLECKPLDLMRMILELYSEVNTVSADLSEAVAAMGDFPQTPNSNTGRGKRHGGRGRKGSLRTFPEAVDRAFQNQVLQGKHLKFGEVLGSLYDALIRPIESHLPNVSYKPEAPPSPRRAGSPSRNWNSPTKKKMLRNWRGLQGRRAASAAPRLCKRNTLATLVLPPRRNRGSYHLLIIPDEFVRHIPFPFLARSPSNYLIDLYLVSSIHSIRVLQFNLAQVRHGRERRGEVLMASFSVEGGMRRGLSLRNLSSRRSSMSPMSMMRTDTKKAIFGLFLSDSQSSLRMAEIGPLKQLVTSTMKNVPKVLQLSKMSAPRNCSLDILRNAFNPLFHIAPPKIIHIANSASRTGKDLPTFQLELNPACGLHLGDSRGVGIRRFESIVKCASTELCVLSHHSDVSSNASFDGLNPFHAALFRAGCPTILYPLFDVCDVFTSLVMVNFYKHFLGTESLARKSKGAAYYQALLGVMQAMPTLRKAPMFVCPFVLFGDAITQFSET